MKRVLPMLAVCIAACDDATHPERPLAYDFTIELEDGFPIIFHWTPASLPVRIWVQPVGDIPHHAENAIRLWENNSLYGEFRGAIVRDSTQADVIVRLRAGESFRVANGTENQANCRGSSSIAVEFDTTITLPFRVNLYPRLGAARDDVDKCLGVMLAHELGHTLGLFLHSDEPADLMHARPQQPALTDRDRATFATLYHTVPTIRIPEHR
jgi:predicted Zn-dependent protease